MLQPFIALVAVALVIGFLGAILGYLDHRRDNALANVYGRYIVNEHERIKWYAKAQAYEDRGIKHYTYDCHQCQQQVIEPVGTCLPMTFRCPHCQSLNDIDQVKPAETVV